MAPRRALIAGLILAGAVAAAIHLSPSPDPLNAESSAASAISASAGHASADTRLAIIRTDSRYLVAGRTSADLVRAFRTIGPPGKEGRRFAARTDWNIRWDYRYARRNRRIVIDTFAVILTVHTILPDWDPSPDADHDLIERWPRYLENLRAHEDGHGTIALESAKKVVRALESLPSARSGADLRDSANAVCHAIIEECRRANTAYDDETGHGRTQGAWLRE